MLQLPGIASRIGTSEPHTVEHKVSFSNQPDMDNFLDMHAVSTDLCSQANLPTLLTTSSGAQGCDGGSLHTEPDVRSASTTFGSRSLPVPLCRDDFEVLELLGAGSFGEVKLVKCKTDDQLYAMKAVEKMTIHERHNLQDCKAADRAQGERDIGVAARQWNCPFIINLNAAFQTNEKLYYVFEYCPGGDLRSLLDDQPQRRFNESAATFYLTEVTYALAHLHQHHTIHRDVKLENVLLDSEGHVRLADFGFAKSCNSDGMASTRFVADADILMPPEFRRGEIYGNDLDCWQLGILAFVMLTGDWPALGSKTWPGALPRGTSAAAGAFCRDLLREVRAERLGYPDGARRVIDHRFFAGIDWDMIAFKAVEPPLQVSCRQGVPMRDTLKTSGMRDLLNFRKFSFVRKSIFGSLKSRRSKKP